MLQSMTGYGKATGTYNDKQIRIEIKSLNSKQMDISTRMPGQYREKDLDLRRMVTQQLERGKVDLSINVSSTNVVASTQINGAILKDYYNQIKQLSDSENIPLPADWFSTLLRLPEVLKNEDQQLEENEWLEVAKITQEAIDQLVKFRVQEGDSLAKVFTTKVDNIERLLSTVGQYEAERIERVKTRLRDGLQNVSENYNADRFEQELIFY
ncbi:MAG: YicC/YloC family endoribonuclease, partial [Bacteroidota bacterium]|nr:YicC/YloC family endoribonuclease [Bacteroidota bacterium]